MNLEAILIYQFPETEYEYGFKDSILYALGLGYGADPMDEEALRFVTEEDQRVVPTQCNVMGYPGFWLRDVPELGFDWVKVVHGEQAIEILGPLRPSGKVISRNRIRAIVDKGADRGAIVHLEREIFDADSGALLARVRTATFARGDGGCGGFGEAPETSYALPAGEPALEREYATSPAAALIYRLSGDFNPLHSCPRVAREAGYDQPILHGMCTMGIACRAIVEAYCGGDPDRLQSMFVRFASPVFPGETIRVQFYPEADGVRFRALAAERNVVVLDRGAAAIRT